MTRKARRGADIDITPLIDVLFMLIIFFVLTAVFVQGSIEIALPQGDGSPISEQNPIVVTVNRNSDVLWAGAPISFEDMPELVAEAMAKSEDILIAGDRDAPYGDVARVLDALRNLGVGSVGLVFEGENASR